MPDLTMIEKETALKESTLADLKKDFRLSDKKQHCTVKNENGNAEKASKKERPRQTTELVTLFLKKSLASGKENATNNKQTEALNQLKQTESRSKAISTLRKRAIAKQEYLQSSIAGASLIILSLAPVVAFSYGLIANFDHHMDQKVAAIEYLTNSKNLPQKNGRSDSFALTKLVVKDEVSATGRTRVNHRDEIRGKSKTRQSRTASMENTDFANRLDGMDRSTLIAAGYSAMHRGENDYALSALTRAARMAPNDALIRQYLAYTLVALNEPEAALSQFNAYEKIRPAVATERIRFAGCLSSTTNTTAAQKYFDQLITAYATDYANLQIIAKQCDSLGFTSQAGRASLLGLKTPSPDEQKLFLELYRKQQERVAPQPQPEQSKPVPHLS